MTDADGVILVYNPDAPSQDQQLADWFEYFVRKNNLRDEQCLLVALRPGQGGEKFKPPPLFSRVTALLAGPDKGPEVKAKFESFMKDLYYIKMRK